MTGFEPWTSGIKRPLYQLSQPHNHCPSVENYCKHFYVRLNGMRRRCRYHVIYCWQDDFITSLSFSLALSLSLSICLSISLSLTPLSLSLSISFSLSWTHLHKILRECIFGKKDFVSQLFCAKNKKEIEFVVVTFLQQKNDLNRNFIFFEKCSCDEMDQSTKKTYHRVAAIAPWFHLRLPSYGPGFESQVHHLCFFQFVLKS